MPQPRTKAAFRGAVIMQVFVKGRRNDVLNGGFHRVNREPRAQSLSESGRASAIIPWVTA
jgi:hypothetical protein